MNGGLYNVNYPAMKGGVSRGDLMMKQLKDEARINYLARVLYELMTNTIAGEQIIEYDGTECDGACLAQDFLDELGIDVDV